MSQSNYPARALPHICPPQKNENTMTELHDPFLSNPPAAAVQTEKHLTFIWGDTSFAISILKIKEIIEFRHLTQVPMMPASMRGVVIPVIDLQARFALAGASVSEQTCIVIVEIEGAPHVGLQVLGIMVDAVSEVLDIDKQHIAPPPQFNTELETGYLQGIAQVNGRFVMLLDVDKVLSIDEISALADPAALA
jgi:purine-binding chemotaxis protein CheW